MGDSFFQHLHPKRTIRARGSSKHLKYLDTNLRVCHRSTFSKILWKWFIWFWIFKIFWPTVHYISGLFSQVNRVKKYQVVERNYFVHEWCNYIDRGKKYYIFISQIFATILCFSQSTFTYSLVIILIYNETKTKQTDIISTVISTNNYEMKRWRNTYSTIIMI